MEHRNIRLSEGVAQNVCSNPESFKRSGISETLDGILENYKGVRPQEEVSFEGVEGIWDLKKVTPDSSTKKTRFDFAFSSSSRSSSDSSSRSGSDGSSRSSSDGSSRSGSDGSSRSGSSDGSSRSGSGDGLQSGSHDSSQRSKH